MLIFDKKVFKNEEKKMNLPFQDKQMRKEKLMHAGALKQNIFILFSLLKKNTFYEIKENKSRMCAHKFLGIWAPL